jgi:hypothetical protein
MDNIVERITDIIKNSSPELAAEEILDLFGVSKPLAQKEVKNCMKADLKCGSVCKEHCGASWC